MRPEQLADIGRQAAAPELPKGRGATQKAFELGKQAAADAILDYVLNKSNMNMIFWEVRPKPFSPPHWMVEENET